MSQTKAQLIDNLVSPITGALGSAAAPTFSFTADPNTGLYSPGADQVAISTGGTERLRITSAGLVGIGNSSPSYLIDASGSATIGIRYKSTSSYGGIIADNSNTTGGGFFAAYQNGTQKSIFGVVGAIAGTTNSDTAVFAETGQGIQFFTNGAPSTPKAVIDSSGRLLVGTSSARTNFFNSSLSAALQLEGTGNARRMSIVGNDAQPIVILAREKSGSVGGNTVVANGDVLGLVSFQGSDGTDFVSGAEIYCEVDGTPGANDMPGRLVFSTTADGAASPTERFRISSDGSFSSVIPGGSTLYPRFGCRAWVNFNGTGTVAIRASGNVSSITDNGVGNYTVNFTTAMPDANYARCVTAGGNTTTTASNIQSPYNSTPTTSALIISTFTTSWGAAQDCNEINVSIFR